MLVEMRKMGKFGSSLWVGGWMVATCVCVCVFWTVAGRAAAAGQVCGNYFGHFSLGEDRCFNCPPSLLLRFFFFFLVLHFSSALFFGLFA